MFFFLFYRRKDQMKDYEREKRLLQRRKRILQKQKERRELTMST